MPFASLIICTRNRAEKLNSMLGKYPKLGVNASRFEMVIVDNGSSDNTANVIDDFRENIDCAVKTVSCVDVGLGNARNAGVTASSGEWLIFTDDDCFLADTFFSTFLQKADVSRFQYGSGQILLPEKDDDPRIASRLLAKELILPPPQILTTGVIQGANMFFHRSVFDRVGLFNKLMGAGTPFACEDIEMACRASIGGYRGALIPDLIAFHHHGRKIGSQEALDTIHAYDFGRGAYYASIFLRFGAKEIFDIWKQGTMNNDRSDIEKLSRELEGAFNYLRVASA